MITRSQKDYLNNLTKYYPGFHKLESLGLNLGTLASEVSQNFVDSYSLDTNSLKEGVFFNPEEKIFLDRLEIKVVQKLDDYNASLQIKSGNEILIDNNGVDLFEQDSIFICSINKIIELPVTYNLDIGNSKKGKINLLFFRGALNE